MKALVGGATSVVGSLNVTSGYPGHSACISGLVRNLDYNSGFPHKSGLPKQRAVAGQKSCSYTVVGDPITDVAVNSVFPLGKPPLSLPQTPTDSEEITSKKMELKARLAYLACHLKSGSLRSLLIHLAEGKPTDQPSRDEFAQIQGLKLLMPGLVLIHGTALQAGDFAAMKNSGTGMVWSPRSNVELYGATANIPAAKQAGVAIAIAPDWSPTGSAGMLLEINYARKYYDYFDAKRLTEMATSIPAKIARIEDRIGRLASGLYADLVVLRAPRRSSPYESIVSASPADVRLVVVGGRPVYGDRELMQKLLPNRNLENLTVCGVAKAVDFGGTGAGQTWTAVSLKLQKQLNLDNATLATFECAGPSAPQAVPTPPGLQ